MTDGERVFRSNERTGASLPNSNNVGLLISYFVPAFRSTSRKLAGPGGRVTLRVTSLP